MFTRAFDKKLLLLIVRILETVHFCIHSGTNLRDDVASAPNDEINFIFIKQVVLKKAVAEVRSGRRNIVECWVESKSIGCEVREE